MIKYNPKNWWGLIFQFHKSDTFRRLFWVMLSLAAFSAGFAYISHEIIGPEKYEGTTVFHSLLGFVISLLLVFRTNTAYDRWWEGRRLWGQLVNNSRNLSIKLSIYIPEEEKELRDRLLKLIIAFPAALKEHLRDQKVADLAPVHIHQPNYIGSELIREVNQLHQDKKINDMQFLSLNTELSDYQNICGACERIKSTPIPYSYSLFIKKFIFIYILSMPFALIMEFHYWTALIVPFVFYVFASLELIAEEIEDPFDMDGNDLPTDQISEKIKFASREIFNSFKDF